MTAFSAPFDCPNKSKHFNDSRLKRLVSPRLESQPDVQVVQHFHVIANEPIGQITATGRLRARSARGYWQMFGSSP